MFISPFNSSLIKKAREKQIIDINITDIRSFAEDKHKMADDYTYGGGNGMVMKVEPVAKAIESLMPSENDPIILLTPQGEAFNQKIAHELSIFSRLILLCGHYEGIDERIREHLATREISVGDYILTGGEIPAMILVDAVARLIPGVLGNADSAKGDSFEQGLLEYPQYTRPSEYRGWAVPEVLLSGHHREIELWRRREALKRTLTRRPDLLVKADLTDEDKKILEELGCKLSSSGM